MVALLNGVFTSHAYCCQFGVPCYCSQVMTTAGQTPQISSVVMLATELLVRILIPRGAISSSRA